MITITLSFLYGRKSRGAHSFCYTDLPVTCLKHREPTPHLRDQQNILSLHCHYTDFFQSYKLAFQGLSSCALIWLAVVFTTKIHTFANFGNTILFLLKVVYILIKHIICLELNKINLYNRHFEVNG